MDISRILILFLSLCFLNFKIFAETSLFNKDRPVSIQATQKLRRAQAVRLDVEIYSNAHFDSEVLTTINPGKFYPISNKLYGPFYKIKISDKVIGYVADTDLNIEGLGALTEKPFLDEDIKQPQFKNKKSNSDLKREEEEDESEDPYGKQNYHELVINLINYHEKTMDQNQIADLWAIGYRYIPFLSDFSASISWDINLSWGVPDYYKDKLNVKGQGGTLWTGAQLVNITPFGSSKTVRYGLGPFLKYSNYNLESVNKSYSLQDLNIGFVFEGGFIYHFNLVAIDFGLRYYWEKTTYGGLSLGFLF